jgi:hypothetical protein
MEAVTLPWHAAAFGARFSGDGTYRYLLWRTWKTEQPALNFLMLNPSTATETKDDPTVHRCRMWAWHWGYGGLVVTNIYAYRATDPRRLWKVADPVGPENDTNILLAAKAAEHVVCAWGVHGERNDRSKTVRTLLKDVSLYAMRITGSGEPMHPLYLPGSATPQPYGEAPAWVRPGPDPSPTEQLVLDL